MVENDVGWYLNQDLVVLARFTFNVSATFLINSRVSQYFSLGTVFEPNTQIARSFVINPFSTHSIMLASKV